MKPNKLIAEELVLHSNTIIIFSHLSLLEIVVMTEDLGDPSTKLFFLKPEITAFAPSTAMTWN
jgi:hypothetical protein